MTAPCPAAPWSQPRDAPRPHEAGWPAPRRSQQRGKRSPAGPASVQVGRPAPESARCQATMSFFGSASGVNVAGGYSRSGSEYAHSWACSLVIPRFRRAASSRSARIRAAGPTRPACQAECRDVPSTNRPLRLRRRL